MAQKVKINIDELAELFDIPEWDGLLEMSSDYIAEAGSSAERYVLKEGASEEEAEQARAKAEEEALDELFGSWHDALMSVVEELFGHHNLNLVPVGKKQRFPFEFNIRPSTTDWRDAANAIRETINGVGHFHFNTVKEFLDSGPYTAREAVLSHLHWIKEYPNVYGGGSARRMFEKRWR